MSHEDLERLVSKRKLMIDKRDEEIKALKAERDDLLKELHKANQIIIDLQRNPPKITAEHLRDVQAEAGRAGFVAGVYAVEVAQILGSYDFDAEKSADEHAESVRQGSA